MRCSTNRPPLPTWRLRKSARTQRLPKEIAEGQQLQQAIRALLGTLADKGQYMDRASFDADLSAAAKAADLKLPAPIKKAIFSALGERDRNAEICRDGKGRPEPDSELRDTENIPLPWAPSCPLPMPVRTPRTNPMTNWWPPSRPTSTPTWRTEVLPHVPDAWVDYGKTKVGYEIPINRHFYVYKPPRPLDEIESEITELEGEITGLLKGWWDDNFPEAKVRIHGEAASLVGKKLAKMVRNSNVDQNVQARGSRTQMSTLCFSTKTLLVDRNSDRRA